MIAKVFFALGCALSPAIAADAASLPAHHQAVPPHFETCGELDQDALSAHSLECFELKIDMSAFDVATPQGIAAAEAYTRQISHRTCRIRNATPTRFDELVYRECRTTLEQDLRRALGLSTPLAD